MSYRDDLAALAARHDALAAEVAHKQRELSQTSQLLDDARTRVNLPVLDNIRVASPCTTEWAQMSGDDRVRACGDCKKNVYNLSEMTRDEAEALIVAKEGRLCVRYYQRKDGTILLADCTIGVSRKRKRRIIAAGAAALLAGGAVFAGRAAYKKHVAEEHEVMMGQMPISDVHDVRGEIGFGVKDDVRHEVVMGKMSPPQTVAPPHAHEQDAPKR